MSAEAENKGVPFFVFLDANSQKVFWGQLLSQTCDKLMSVGMIWVLSTQFSPKWVPWFIAFGALPHFLLASVSGNWIARWGALRTVIWSDMFRGFLFLFAAWFCTYTKSSNHLLFLLLASAVVSNIAGSLFNPAILSLPVSMMEEGEKRDKLTAMIDSCFSLGNVLGPLLSAVIYASSGLAAMLAINGLSYFFSAILALSIRIPAISHKQVANIAADKACDLTHSSITAAQAANAAMEADSDPHSIDPAAESHDIRTESILPGNQGEANASTTDAKEPLPLMQSGNAHELENNSNQKPDAAHRAARSLLEVMRSQPVISGMLLTFLMMNFFLAPLMIFMPWYAKNVYGAGIMGLAQLEAFLGVGTVIGGLLLSFVKLPGATWKRVSICLTLMATAYLSFTFSQQLWIGCVSVLSLGFFLALSNVITLTFFQTAPEASDVPVVMAMVNLISVASLPVSMGIIGSFVEHVPVQPFAAICAAVVILIALSIRLIPGIRGIA